MENSFTYHTAVQRVRSAQEKIPPWDRPEDIRVDHPRSTGLIPENVGHPIIVLEIKDLSQRGRIFDALQHFMERYPRPDWQVSDIVGRTAYRESGDPFVKVKRTLAVFVALTFDGWNEKYTAYKSDNNLVGDGSIDLDKCFAAVL